MINGVKFMTQKLWKTPYKSFFTKIKNFKLYFGID